MADMARDMEPKRRTPARKPSGPLPGLGPLFAMAIVSGIASWFWLTEGQAKPADATAPNTSGLTAVDDKDLTGALTTIAEADVRSGQFQQGKDGRCRRPLAWVSVVSAPGEPPSRIRIVSGNYYSPMFQVSATPVRIALPYPAPYETGRGMLTAIDIGGGATISLFPGWHISASQGRTTREVTWNPANRCSPANG